MLLVMQTDTSGIKRPRGNFFVDLASLRRERRYGRGERPGAQRQRRCAGGGTQLARLTSGRSNALRSALTKAAS